MFRKKNVCLIISVIVAVIWVFVGISTMTSAGGALENEAESLEEVGSQITRSPTIAIVVINFSNILRNSIEKL